MGRPRSDVGPVRRRGTHPAGRDADTASRRRRSPASSSRMRSASSSTRCRVTRIHEDPRVTKPYTDEQWTRSCDLGDRVDGDLGAGDVRLTMGGEPTFVSIDDMDGEEWNTAALGPTKQRLRGGSAQPPARAVRARADCCTSDKASGTRANRCRVGHSAVTGVPTACRSGTIRDWLADPAIATTDSGDADAQRFAEDAGRAAWRRPELRRSPRTKIRWRTSRRNGNCRSTSIRESNALDDPRNANGCDGCSRRGLGQPHRFRAAAQRASGNDGPTWQSGLVDASLAAPVPAAGRLACRLAPAAGVARGEPAEVVRQVWTVDPMSARGPLARPVHRSRSPDGTHSAAGARPEQSFVAGGGAADAGSRQVQIAQTLSSTDPVVRTAVSVETAAVRSGYFCRRSHRPTTTWNCSPRLRTPRPRLGHACSDRRVSAAVTIRVSRTSRSRPIRA